MGKLALPRQDGSNAVTPHTLHSCQNSRLVVDQHVMASRITPLDVVEFMLFMDIYQNTTANRFEDAGSRDFARLEDDITIGQI